MLTVFNGTLEILYFSSLVLLLQRGVAFSSGWLASLRGPDASRVLSHLQMPSARRLSHLTYGRINAVAVVSNTFRLSWTTGGGGRGVLEVGLLR